jgi:hypothetical protein
LIIILIQAVVMAHEMILLGEKFDAVAAETKATARGFLDPKTAMRVGAFLN